MIQSAFLCFCTGILLFMLGNTGRAVAAPADTARCRLIVQKQISMKPGKTMILPVQVKLQKGWYIYGFTPAVNKDGIGPQATEILISDSTGSVKTDTVIAPSAHKKYDEAFEMDVESFKSSFTCKVKLSTSAQAPRSCITVPVLFTYQLCDGTMCLPPVTVQQSLRVVID
jgi:DsbC/DsbD-like thiol-disulfide interchange protein